MGNDCKRPAFSIDIIIVNDPFLYSTLPFNIHNCIYTIISFFRHGKIFGQYSSEKLLHKNYSTTAVTVRMVTLVRNLFHMKYYQPKIKCAKMKLITVYL